MYMYTRIPLLVYTPFPVELTSGANQLTPGAIARTLRSYLRPSLLLAARAGKRKRENVCVYLCGCVYIRE